MIDTMKNPNPSFKTIIEKHFILKKDEILQQMKKWSEDECFNLSNKQIQSEFMRARNNLEEFFTTYNP